MALVAMTTHAQPRNEPITWRRAVVSTGRGEHVISSPVLSRFLVWCADLERGVGRCSTCRDSFRCTPDRAQAGEALPTCPRGMTGYAGRVLDGMEADAETLASLVLLIPSALQGAGVCVPGPGEARGTGEGVHLHPWGPVLGGATLRVRHLVREGEADDAVREPAVVRLAAVVAWLERGGHGERPDPPDTSKDPPAVAARRMALWEQANAGAVLARLEELIPALKQKAGAREWQDEGLTT